MTRPSDQHLMLGDVPDQVSPDVGSLVSGTAGRDGVGDQLRSLAHPEWPYAGTAHEWRGFVNTKTWVSDAIKAFAVGETIKAMDGRYPPSTIAEYQRLKFGRLD